MCSRRQVPPFSIGPRHGRVTCPAAESECDNENKNARQQKHPAGVTERIPGKAGADAVDQCVAHDHSRIQESEHNRCQPNAFGSRSVGRQEQYPA